MFSYHSWQSVLNPTNSPPSLFIFFQPQSQLFLLSCFLGWECYRTTVNVLKLDSHIIFIFFDKILLKMIRNDFYFILKTLFLFDISTFLSWLFDYHIVRLTMWHLLFLGFWLIDTWFFADWRHHRAVVRLENVRQSNIRRCKKLGFQLSHKHPPM